MAKRSDDSPRSPPAPRPADDPRDLCRQTQKRPGREDRGARCRVRWQLNKRGEPARVKDSAGRCGAPLAHSSIDGLGTGCGPREVVYSVMPTRKRRAVHAVPQVPISISVRRRLYAMRPIAHDRSSVNGRRQARWPTWVRLPRFLADHLELPIGFLLGLECQRPTWTHVVSVGRVSTTLHFFVSRSWTT